MTNFQTLMLRRLSAEFDVDVKPAQTLEGAALDAWIERAEDDLFEELMAPAHPAIESPKFLGQDKDSTVFFQKPIEAYCQN